MKKIFSVFVIVFVFVATASAGKYVIKGTIGPEYNGKKVFMMINGNFIQGEYNQNVDSAVVKDGKFEMHGDVKGDCIRFISAGDKATDFILEPGTLEVDMEAGKCLSTPLNRALAEYSEAEKTITAKSNKIFMDSTISEREKYDLQKKTHQRYFDLAKEYVAKYAKTSVAERIIYFFYENSCAEFDTLCQIRGDRPFTYRPLIGKAWRNNGKRKTEPGQMFSDFTIEHGNLDGTDVKLSDYVGRGKYVLIDFWASWCGWCIKEFPVLRDVYKKHKGDNFEMVGIMVQDKEAASRKAIEKEKPEWPQIINAGKIPMEVYGVSGIPEIILFAPDGTIIERGLRGQHLKDVVDNAIRNSSH